MTEPRNNTELLVDVFAQQTQQIETALLEVLVDTRLENAEGVQLDVIGVIVGLERGALSDDDYRARLLVRIQVNQSSGTIPEVLSVVENMLATDQQITLTEYLIASFVIRIDDALPISGGVLAAEVQKARAAGVKTQIEYTDIDDDDTFTFATADAVEFSDRQGWSNDAGTSGGVWSFVEEA
jgi:hypothetical protein